MWHTSLLVTLTAQRPKIWLKGGFVGYWNIGLLTANRVLSVWDKWAAGFDKDCKYSNNIVNWRSTVSEEQEDFSLISAVHPAHLKQEPQIKTTEFRFVKAVIHP